VLGSKVSPAQIDHVIEKGTGGLGTKAIRALEGTATALSGGGTDKLKRASEELSLFRRFNVSKDYSESLDEVYDRAETLTQQLNSQKKAGKERNPDMMAEKSRLNRVKDLNSSLRDLMEGMSDRDQRFSVEKYIIGLSRWGLGKKDLDRYTNPLGLKGLPDNVRAVISEALTKTIIRSIVETDSEDEGYLQSIESARVFLKQTGITKAQAGALLTKYYRGEPLSRDRYSRKQQIKKRAAKRRTLARLMQ